MKFKVARKRLAPAVRVLACAVDEAKLFFAASGLNAKVVDPAHVCMIEVSIPDTAFGAYSLLEDESVGVDLDKLKEVLSIPGAEDISFETKDGKLWANIGGTTRKMQIIDPVGIIVPKIPAIHVAESIDVPLAEFQTAVKAASSVSDHVAVRTDPPDLLFEAEGDTDTVEHRVPGAGTKTKVRSLMALDYLHNFAASLPEDAKLRFHVGDDYPLRIEFSWGEGAQTIAGTYLLAPRIEAND